MGTIALFARFKHLIGSLHVIRARDVSSQVDGGHNCAVEECKTKLVRGRRLQRSIAMDVGELQAILASGSQ